MRIPDDTLCKFCQGVFCCAECRHKHEIRNHAIAVRRPVIKIHEENKSDENESIKGQEVVFSTFLLCSLCLKQPLVLTPDLPKEMILHIELYHLPLRCRKCSKIYDKTNDFKEFSKCLCQSRELSVSNQSNYTDEVSKITVTKAAVPQCIISQSSPLRPQDFSESHMTPISIINMRWKAKSKLSQEEFISDSMSSIKNLSSINNSSIRCNKETSSVIKGKVIRCSSTPVQLEMVFTKPKEQTFNSSGGHMSSIQYNSGCESETSPAFSQSNSHALEPVNRYVKVAGSRARMSAVTPLRQVMSKSIQKAFAEHGLPPPNTANNCYTFQRKNMFESTSSPEINEEESPMSPALDLRLSPAVRRYQAESEEPLQNKYSNQHEKCNEQHNLRREILLSAQKLTTESIVITRTEHLSSVSSSTSVVSSNYSINSVSPYPGSTDSSYQSAGSNTTVSSVFKSSSSVEIITATRENIQQIQQPFNNENMKNTAMPNLTPITRIPGPTIHKKLIKFETPKLELCDSREFENSPTDEFFTPNATPIRSSSDVAEMKKRALLAKQNLYGRFSPQRRPSIKNNNNRAFSSTENLENDFAEIYRLDDEAISSQESEKSSEKLNIDTKETKTQQSSSLWSLMASVIRLPSLKGKKTKESCLSAPCSSLDSNTNSLIKRCASIAGSLVRSKSLVDGNELSSLKRKRSYTIDNQPTSPYLVALNKAEDTSPTPDFNTSSKRFRIQGRQPINRMRLNS